MILKQFLQNFIIAYEAMLQNKLRAILTSLGIICGVASVIAMLAIGKGAEQEILEKMKLLGANNLIIAPETEEEKEKKQLEEGSEDNSNNSDETKKKKRFSPGLTINDAKNIKKFLPIVENVSVETVLKTIATYGGFRQEGKLVGVNSDFFEINNLTLESGSIINNHQFENSAPVCIIGSRIKTRLFPTENPIGKSIKCDGKWLRVIAVIKNLNITKENIQNLNIRDLNLDIYIPISTMLIRFENRNLITKKDLERTFYFSDDAQPQDENYNQIDRMVVKVKAAESIYPTADVIKRMLKRRHNNEEDFTITIPEQLLKQEQQTRSIFNIVLGAIASISLVVGGIGIMNIMLASVLERIKEIGIRMAVGARQRDIMMQFLSEAVAISLSGGILGIILGFALSLIIEKSTGIQTIVSAYSVILSFFVSIAVGIIFGIMPARKASMQDPIVSLRYE